jgi:ATP-binding cassette subfamily F protein 3
LERTERIDAPTLERKTIKFRFPQPPRTGRVVAEVKHARKAYGENVVYKRLDLMVERGEKIALVGPNGAGKSTLLKLLAGVIQPDSGTVKLGHAVRREYFAQHQLEVLHPGRTVLKTMEEVAGPVGRLPEVRGYLGTFLFGEDDVTKKVAVLSGGEKARLALARMLLDPAGLLLLDEPTNHLDMDSRAVLTEALRQFEGSVVFISHDRHLINAIGTKVIEVRDGRLAHYPGDWEYYLWKKAQDASLSPSGSAFPAAGGPPANDSSKPGPKPGSTPGPKLEPKAAASVGADSSGRAASGREAAATRLGYQERKDLQRRYRKAEKAVFALEERQKELAALLSDPAHISDYELLYATSEELTAVKERLSIANAEWEELAEGVAGLEEDRSPAAGTA